MWLICAKVNNVYLLELFQFYRRRLKFFLLFLELIGCSLVLVFLLGWVAQSLAPWYSSSHRLQKSYLQLFLVHLACLASAYSLAGAEHFTHFTSFSPTLSFRASRVNLLNKDVAFEFSGLEVLGDLVVESHEVVFVRSFIEWRDNPAVAPADVDTTGSSLVGEVFSYQIKYMYATLYYYAVLFI